MDRPDYPVIELKHHLDKQSNGWQVALHAWRMLGTLRGNDIFIYNLKPLFTTADYFVAVTGTSRGHLRAMADILSADMRSRSIADPCVSGNGGTWIVVDCGRCIIHLMDRQVRSWYDVDRIWGPHRMLIDDEREDDSMDFGEIQTSQRSHAGGERITCFNESA